MEKTLMVTGMHCGGCERRAKKVLEALPEVESATASHEKGTVTVTLTAPLPNETLKSAIEGLGFEVTAIV